MSGLPSIHNPNSYERKLLESIVATGKTSNQMTNTNNNANRTVGGGSSVGGKRRPVNRRLEEPVGDLAPHPTGKQRQTFDAKANSKYFGSSGGFSSPSHLHQQNVRSASAAAAAAASGGGGGGGGKSVASSSGGPTVRVLHSDIERGAWSMIERGLLPSNFDMELVMNGPKKGGMESSSPLQCGGARMHKHDEQFERKETQTGAASTAGFSNVKYDVKSLEGMPHDRNQFMQVMEHKKAVLALEPTPLMKVAAAQSTRRLLDNNGPSATKKIQDAQMKGASQAAKNLLALTKQGVEEDERRRREEKEKEGIDSVFDADIANKTRENTRNYTEMLDKFSLHEFIIRKGVSLRNTPEFNSFHRSNVQKWSAINDVILHLERLLFETAVPMAYIDGKKVVDLALVDNGVCSRDQLLSCITNREQIEDLVTKMSNRFLFAPRRFDLAAGVIQACFRGFRQFKQYRLLHAANHAAVKIQRQYGVHRMHKTTQHKLRLQKEQLLDKWQMTVEKFKKDWPMISKSRRVVIHVPSISIGSDHKVPVFAEYFQREILPRLAQLADPNIESIVMVSPARPDDDTISYYLNALKSAGVENVEGRLSIFVPELVAAATQQSAGVPKRHRVTLPPLTLAKMTLCSSNLMTLISSAFRGRSAYMLCDVVTEDEQLLAAKLNLPILGCTNPYQSMLYSTKSGGRQLLAQADVNIPVGAVGIRTTDELYLALSKLIVENPTVLRWVIKLDAERNGRGIAVLDTKRIRSYDEVTKLFDLASPHPHNQQQQQQQQQQNSNNNNESGFGSPTSASSGGGRKEPPTIGAATAVAAKIYGELKEVAARRIKISHAAAYPDWQSFTIAMKKMTCVIEAAPNDIVGSPVAHLFIPPHNSGEAQILGVQQQIVSPLTFISLGVVYPQACVPDEAVLEASKNVGQVLKRSGVSGFVSVDFVCFRKDSQQQQQQQQLTHQQQQQQQAQKKPSNKVQLRMWVVGVRPCLTVNSSIHEFACVLRHESTQVQSQLDISFRSSIRPPFCYSYTGIVHHPHISALKHPVFFQIARQRGLAFEPERTPGFEEMCAVAAANNGEILMGGTVFHLIDSLLCGAIGALFLGPTPARCAELFCKFTELLHQQLSAENALLDDPRGNLLHLLAAARTFTVMHNFTKKPQAAALDTSLSGSLSSGLSKKTPLKSKIKEMMK